MRGKKRQANKEAQNCKRMEVREERCGDGVIKENLKLGRSLNLPLERVRNLSVSFDYTKVFENECKL